MSVYADKMADLARKRDRVRKWPRKIKRTGLSREAWALANGRDPGQLSKWINEKEAPTWTTIEEIDALLDDQAKAKPRRKMPVGKPVRKGAGKSVRDI